MKRFSFLSKRFSKSRVELFQKVFMFLFKIIFFLGWVFMSISNATCPHVFMSISNATCKTYFWSMKSAERKWKLIATVCKCGHVFAPLAPRLETWRHSLITHRVLQGAHTCKAYRRCSTGGAVVYVSTWQWLPRSPSPPKIVIVLSGPHRPNSAIAHTHRIATHTIR